jgi:hypothetical protein
MRRWPDRLAAVDTRHLAEAFLSGSIPQLDVDIGCSVPEDALVCEINADDDPLEVGEGALDAPADEAGFCGARVIDDDDFERLLGRRLHWLGDRGHQN